MDDLKARPDSSKPSSRLTHCEITVQSRPHVLVNGRQQIHVKAYLEVTTSLNHEPLSNNEKNSLCLVNYDTGEVIPFSQDGSEHYKGWSAQREDMGYERDPALLRPDDQGSVAAPHARGETFDFYLTAGPAALGSTLNLAFSVALDNRWTCLSNGMNYFPEEGEETSAYTSESDFPGPAMAALKLPVYGPRNYLLELTSGPPVNPVFNLTYALSLVSNDDDTVRILSLEAEPAGMIHWPSDTPGLRAPCYTGYVRPGETTVNWNNAVPVGKEPRPPFAGDAKDRPVFLVCGRIDIPRDGLIDPPEGPLSLVLMDAKGTIQRCGLQFRDQTRSELEIIG